MIARIRPVFAALVATALLALPAAQANPSAKTAAPARTAAPAKTAAPARTAAAQGSPKVKTLIFGEGSELEGAVVGPDGETVEARIDLIHSSLIRVRTDFLREIHRTADDL